MNADGFDREPKLNDGGLLGLLVWGPLLLNIPPENFIGWGALEVVEAEKLNGETDVVVVVVPKIPPDDPPIEILPVCWGPPPNIGRDFCCEAGWSCSVGPPEENLTPLLSPPKLNIEVVVLGTDCVDLGVCSNLNNPPVGNFCRGAAINDCCKRLAP